MGGALGRSEEDTCCFHLRHNVLQLAAGLVGAVVVAESVHHLLVLELVLIGDWNKSKRGNVRGTWLEKGKTMRGKP